MSLSMLQPRSNDLLIPSLAALAALLFGGGAVGQPPTGTGIVEAVSEGT